MASETGKGDFKLPFETCLMEKATGAITELLTVVKVTKTAFLVEQPRTKRIYPFARWAWEPVKWN